MMSTHYIFVDANRVAYAEAEVNDDAFIAVPPPNSALTDADIANMEAQGIVIDLSQLPKEA